MGLGHGPPSFCACRRALPPAGGGRLLGGTGGGGVLGGTGGSRALGREFAAAFSAGQGDCEPVPALATGLDSCPHVTSYQPLSGTANYLNSTASGRGTGIQSRSASRSGQVRCPQSRCLRPANLLL